MVDLRAPIGIELRHDSAESFRRDDSAESFSLVGRRYPATLRNALPVRPREHEHAVVRDRDAITAFVHELMVE